MILSLSMGLPYAFIDIVTFRCAAVALIDNVPFRGAAVGAY